MKILLVDDHAVFREGIALLLTRLQPDVATICAGSCEEAFAALQSDPEIDLVLLDLCLPDMSGLDAIHVLCERFAEVPVVVLSSVDDQPTVLRAIDSGAMGFIPKKYSSGTLIAALRLILAKQIYLPPSVFLGEIHATPLPRIPQEHSEPVKKPVTPTDLGFTPRQSEVVYLLLQGKSNRQISRLLKLSEGTVRSHTSAVLRALNVSRRHLTMKILLVDDHAMFRDAIAHFLTRLQPDVVTICVGSCEEAFTALQSDPEIDLVLLELCLPDMTGLDALRVLRERFAEIPIVVLSSTDDQQTALRSIDSGAMGFISKKSSRDTLIAELRLMLAKCIYSPPSDLT